MSLFDVERKKPMGDDFKYSRAIKIPQYVPNSESPLLESLIDFTKYTELIRNIQNSKVTPEQKSFLKYAAARHLVFNYALIADYYAHADKEMQELMEQSALVILDIDDAIANGYVKLTKKMNQLIQEEKQRRNSSE